MTFDPKGRLVVCQQGKKKIIKREQKGPITVLAENYAGKRLNSPNDLVFKSDGKITKEQRAGGWDKCVFN